MPWHANYLLRRALGAQLRAAVAERLSGRSELRVLDVGCGGKPYAPLIEPYAAEYVGLDYRPGPNVDVVARAERLPFDAQRFDALLCSQVLEHSDDPSAVLREAWRVLRPGGVAFVSTHGVVNYHPNPDDYWRWTQTGLARLFKMTGRGCRSALRRTEGPQTALGYLMGRQAEALAAKTPVRTTIAPLVFFLNVAAWNLDRLYRRHYVDRPPNLACNYLAVAVRAAT